MPTNPLISILVPCYNQGEFLNDSMHSVYNQTYTNWECIIINDGSTDDSERIAKQWAAKDSRFQYYYKENSGVSATRNLALQKAKGAYIQFLDADDFIDKEKLELSLNEIGSFSDKEKTIVFSNFRMFIDNSKITKAPFCALKLELFTFENVLYKWNEAFSIPIHTALVEASLFKTIRFPEYLTAQEDWLVWVKLFKQGAKPVFMDKPLALYRFNPMGRTKSKPIFEDQMRVYESFKELLSDDEFYELSKTLIKRYLKKQKDYKKRFNDLKKSNTYQVGLLIKKVLKTIKVLNFAKRIFPIFLKFKSK